MLSPKRKKKRFASLNDSAAMLRHLCTKRDDQAEHKLKQIKMGKNRLNDERSSLRMQNSFAEEKSDHRRSSAGGSSKEKLAKRRKSIPCPQ